MKPDPGWKREFNDPIPLPRGRQLITLEDAGNYISQLRKAVHEAPEWQAATEALLLVVTLGGPTMFARIGMMKALNPNVDRTFDRRFEDRLELGPSGDLAADVADNPTEPAA